MGLPFYSLAGGSGGGGAGASITRGTYSTTPEGQPAGSVRLVTDAPLIRYYNGSSWEDDWPGVGPVTVPPTSGWSWDNQGSALAFPSGPMLSLSTPPSGGLDIHNYVRSTPATPWQLQARFYAVGGRQRTMGLTLRESSTGEFYRWGFCQTGSGGSGCCLFYNTSTTAGSTAIVTSNTYPAAGIAGFGIVDDGTDLYFSILLPSTNAGASPILVHTEARNARMTTGPDQFGIHVAATTTDAQLDLVSWVEGSFP